jgi:hypothetical protein
VFHNGEHNIPPLLSSDKAIDGAAKRRWMRGLCSGSELAAIKKFLTGDRNGLPFAEGAQVCMPRVRRGLLGTETNKSSTILSQIYLVRYGIRANWKRKLVTCKSRCKPKNQEWQTTKRKATSRGGKGTSEVELSSPPPDAGLFTNADHRLNRATHWCGRAGRKSFGPAGNSIRSPNKMIPFKEH